MTIFDFVGKCTYRRDHDGTYHFLLFESQPTHQSEEPENWPGLNLITWLAHFLQTTPGLDCNGQSIARRWVSIWCVLTAPTALFKLINLIYYMVII